MHVVDTSDREEAAEALARSFPGLHLGPASADRPFHFFHSRETKGFITYSRLNVRGTIGTTGFYPDEFAVVRRFAGNIAIEYGPEALETTACYLRPQGHSVARYEDSRAELVSVEPHAFRRMAGRYLEGSGRRLVTPTAERAAPSAEGMRLWNAAADLIARDDGTSALRTSVLEDLVATTLLVAFPLSEDHSAAAGTSVLPRALRRASAFIEDHLREPISIPQIAEAARVSVRTLEYGFRERFGLTPSAYLREARMRAAHSALVRADPDRTTVAAIAREWGFSNSGRFAVAYRARYQESPSDTLRR